MEYTSEPQLISMNYYENHEKKNENDMKIIIIIFKWDIIFIQSIPRPYHHQQLLPILPQTLSRIIYNLIQTRQVMTPS